MTGRMTEEAVYEEARKRVKAKREFYKHLLTYVIVNAGLILIWAFAADRGYPWFLWVLGGWGIGLVFNFLNAFVWVGRKDMGAIEKEAEAIRRQQG